MDGVEVPEDLEAQGGTRDTSWLCSFCFSHPIFSVCVFSVTLLCFYLLVVGVVLQDKWKRGNLLLFQGRYFLYYGIISTAAFFLVFIYSLRPKNVTNTLLISPPAKLVSFLLGVKWELRGVHLLDELAGRCRDGGTPKSVVLVANHQSTLDSLGLMHLWKWFHPMAVIIKKEVLYVWPFGLAAYLAGSIFVDRSRGKTALYSIEASAHRAAKDKVKMFVFPEGTRNRNNMSWEGGDHSSKELLPFKSGAFRAAISAGVPIVPVVFSPYVFVDEKRLLFGQGKVIIKVLPEIQTNGLTVEDIPALTEKTRQIISEEYKALRNELLSEIPPDHLVICKKVK